MKDRKTIMGEPLLQVENLSLRREGRDILRKG
jgi:ABC-type molybdenum transport system ATPase subunit/photorepair protein PhrA